MLVTLGTLRVNLDRLIAAYGDPSIHNHRLNTPPHRRQYYFHYTDISIT